MWSDGAGWIRDRRVPATEVPRTSAGFLAEEKVGLGNWWFRQKYLCYFVEAEDAFFHDDVAGAISNDVRPLFAIGGAPS